MLNQVINYLRYNHNRKFNYRGLQHSVRRYKSLYNKYRHRSNTYRNYLRRIKSISRRRNRCRRRLNKVYRLSRRF